MAARVNRPLKVVAFHANGVARQRYELSMELQELHTDVALLSNIHLKHHERSFFIQIFTFIGLTTSQAKKMELPLQLENACLPLFQ
jgi:hypothetical protein